MKREAKKTLQSIPFVLQQVIQCHRSFDLFSVLVIPTRFIQQFDTDRLQFVAQ